MSKAKKVLKVIGIIFGSLIALIIVVDIILNIVFGIQLRNKLAELKAEGKPITIAEIVPPPVPDEENAAVLYNKAFTLMALPEMENTFKTIADVKSFSDISEWTDEQREEIPKIINSRDMQYIYELLKESSKKPKCNFNLEYEKGINISLPHLQYMRNSMRLLCIKALLEAESGKTTQAFDTLLIGLKLSSCLKDEFLISQLLRVACDGIIIQCIENISDPNGIPVEKAKLIMNELSIHQDIEPFIKCMDGERVGFGGWVFERTLNDKISWGDMLRNIGGIEEGEDTLVRRIFFSLFPYLYRPIFKKDYICYLTLMSKAQNSYNQPYYQVAQEDRKDEPIPKYCILTNMLLPAVGRVREMIARHQAIIEVCRTGLALKIYKAKNGTYPEKLEDLAPEFLKEIPIDPFSGESLVYSRYGGGFKLYSFGPNMRDDFGTKRTYKKDSPASENYDIVWESGS